MAVEWYASQNDTQKQALREDQMEAWNAKLIAEFRDPIGKAIRNLQMMRYILNDAINRKSFRHFVHSTRRVAQQA